VARRQPQLNMAVVFLSLECFVTAGTLKPLCVTFGLCISYADVERRTWLVFVASQQPQLNMVLASLSFELLASSSLSLSLFSVFRMDALARFMLSRHSSMRRISTATTPPPSFEIEHTFCAIEFSSSLCSATTFELPVLVQQTFRVSVSWQVVTAVQ